MDGEKTMGRVTRRTMDGGQTTGGMMPIVVGINNLIPRLGTVLSLRIPLIPEQRRMHMPADGKAGARRPENYPRLNNPTRCLRMLEHRSLLPLRITGNSINLLNMEIDTRTGSQNPIDPINSIMDTKARRTNRINYNVKTGGRSRRARAVGDGRKRYMMCGDLVTDGVTWMTMKRNRIWHRIRGAAEFISPTVRYKRLCFHLPPLPFPPRLLSKTSP
jgi:hypothetical protein